MSTATFQSELMLKLKAAWVSSGSDAYGPRPKWLTPELQRLWDATVLSSYTVVASYGPHPAYSASEPPVVHVQATSARDAMVQAIMKCEAKSQEAAEKSLDIDVYGLTVFPGTLLPV